MVRRGLYIGAELLPYVGFAAVTVLLVVAYVFVLPERTLLLLSPRLLKLSHESLDDAVMWPPPSGLTEREYEIFMLLARGRDVARRRCSSLETP